LVADGFLARAHEKLSDRQVRKIYQQPKADSNANVVKLASVMEDNLEPPPRQGHEGQYYT
jgi:hypothetical protein